MKPVDHHLTNGFLLLRSMVLEWLVAMLEVGMLVAAVVVQLKTMPLHDKTTPC